MRYSRVPGSRFASASGVPLGRYHHLVLLDDLAAMAEAYESHRYEISPGRVLTITPPPGCVTPADHDVG